MIENFIKKPILSSVINIFIVLIGVLALLSLPVTQFPDIVPPSVVVTAKYTGANAEVCAKTVATPIERAINGVPGMTYMNTVTSNNGTTIITIFFNVGIDPDVAAVNVQNRVTTVLDELPEEVIKAGVTTEKEVNTILMYLNILSDDPAANEEFVYNFADINILRELKRIDGVGFCEIMGNRDYAMRVWLKPDRMSSYKVSHQEITDAIRAQNIEAAPGKTGQSFDLLPQQQEYVLKYTGKFKNPEEYENIVIRSNTDGSLLKLKDVANIDFGSFDYGMASRTDGKPSASIMIKQRPGSNARDLIKSIKEKMTELEGRTFPPGMKFNVSYDVSRFLDASIAEVLKTLIEAFLLVSLVVFIFLQDWRSTLIPALAVPVSLIGTFAIMQLMGFSINLLTLFALVLSIGIVVDNAIVVVESVHSYMTIGKKPPLEASILAMKDIGGALVSITMVMSAVFIPVAFLSGPVGIFYRQFSVTLAVAIVLSGINALTVTPALCALLLKPHVSAKKQKKNPLTRFFYWFNRFFEKLTRLYQRLSIQVAGRKYLTLGILLMSMVLTALYSNWLPKGFIPVEDQGMIYANITTPAGATLDRTQKVLEQLTAQTGDIEEIENVSTLAGYSIITESNAASYGMAMINLKKWEDRERDVFEIIRELEEKALQITDAKIEFFPPPTVPGFGNAAGFEFRLVENSQEENLMVIKESIDKFTQALNQRKELQNVFTGFDPTFPQYTLSIDQDLAAKNHVSIDDAMSTLQTLVGSYYASNFTRFGQMYKVMLQASPEYTTTPEQILRLQVKNEVGEMVPISNFVKITKVYGPEQLTRYNMNTAAMFNGEAAQGYSTGQAIEIIEEVARETLSQDYTIEWAGITREEILAGDQTLYIYILVVIFVFLLLAAQYESFKLPLPVLLSVITGIMGSFMFLKVFGLENNIYAQVSIVMLIGLLGKNAILIVEFANQAVEKGMQPLKAAQMLRLRPDVAAAEYRLKAAGFDVKAATAAFYPNITLTPFVGLNSFNSEFFFNPASLVYGIFGGVTAPIFQQYQLKANQLEKSARAREALYHYENIVLTAYSEVFTQISAFDNYSKVIDLKT